MFVRKSLAPLLRPCLLFIFCPIWQELPVKQQLITNKFHSPLPKRLVYPPQMSSPFCFVSFFNFKTLAQPYFICIPTWGKRENVWLSADVNRHIATQPAWDQISFTTKLQLSLKKFQLDCYIIIYLWHPQKYSVLHWRLYYRLPSLVYIPSQDQTASERKPVKYKITLLLTSHISKGPLKTPSQFLLKKKKQIMKSYLVCGEKIEVIGRVCDHISLARCVWSRTVVSEPARKIFKSLWNTFSSC